MSQKPSSNPGSSELFMLTRRFNLDESCAVWSICNSFCTLVSAIIAESTLGSTKRNLFV